MAEEQAPATEEVAQEQPAEEEVSRETSEVMERPEIIPEKFWNNETGEINLEDMAKSYAHLERFASGKKDEMREAVMSEIEAEARESLPESAEAYTLPKLVEGVTEEMVENNPLTGWWRNKCHEMGLDQELFEDGINQYVDFMQSSVPDIDAEMEKLGENANDRLNAVNSWAQSFFPPEEFETIVSTLGTSAQGIAVLERIQDSMKSSMGRSESVAQPERELSIADVKQMMNDKRYYDSRHRDADYVRKVDEAWARLNTAGKV
tara:strand:- start:6684 stop:7472 length:789 start_codon:yes stop_codon:yes gene_type:complete